MATVAALTERVRLISLSLGRATSKAQVANWAHQLAHVAADLSNLADPVSVRVAVIPPAPAVLSADQVYAKFLDAADAALLAAGKPAGRDGAERGALSRGQAASLIAGIGPDALSILKAGGYDILGPEPEAGTLA